ncbi:MAG: hypothetical protein ABMA25_05720 [Ilumatobacteraceae bacterium]
MTSGRALVASLAEAVAVATGGALLGWAPGRLVHPSVGIAMALVAGANGAIGGWRGVYGWRRPSGWLAFVLDSTWATLPVMVGLLTHVVALVSRSAGYEPSLSHRQHRHVYRRGAHLKPGFALTVGNVISGAGNVDGPRRRRLITDHEAVHVWQARWFGVLYLPLYGLWAAAAAVVGVLVWVGPRREQPLGKVVESCAYYLNPFEWWAYSRDALWPPPGLLHGFGWRRAAARPLAEVRRPRVR